MPHQLRQIIGINIRNPNILTVFDQHYTKKP